MVQELRLERAFSEDFGLRKIPLKVFQEVDIQAT